MWTTNEVTRLTLLLGQPKQDANMTRLHDLIVHGSPRSIAGQLNPHQVSKSIVRAWLSFLCIDEEGVGLETGQQMQLQA